MRQTGTIAAELHSNEACVVAHRVNLTLESLAVFEIILSQRGRLQQIKSGIDDWINCHAIILVLSASLLLILEEKETGLAKHCIAIFELEVASLPSRSVFDFHWSLENHPLVFMQLA